MVSPRAGQVSQREIAPGTASVQAQRAAHAPPLSVTESKPGSPPSGLDPFWTFNKNNRYDTPLRERPPAAPFHLGSSFEEFLSDPDMRRWAWREMVCAEEPARWREADIRAAEEELRVEDSVFGRRLHELLLRRGHQQLRRTNIKLEFWIRELPFDTDPGAADVWLLISRGLEVLPEGAPFKPQFHDNYKSCTEVVTEEDGSLTDMAEVVTKEVTRLHAHQFCLEYELAAKRAGFSADKFPPELISPLACIRKEVSFGDFKDRCVTDASKEDEEGVALNDLVDCSQACRLASVDVARQGCGRHHAGWVADQTDAFPWLPNAAHSVRQMCFRWRGVTYAWVRCNFGMRHTPRAQQSVSICFARATRRHVTLGGLRMGPVAGHDQRQQPNKPFNEAKGLYTRCRRQAHAQLVAAATATDGKLEAALRRIATATPHSDVAADGVTVQRLRGGAEGERARRLLEAKTRLLIKEEKAAASVTHSVDCLHQYLDDTMGCGTVMASWYCFVTFLSICMLGGFRLNMKESASRAYDKTQCPHSRFCYQGLNWDLHAFMLTIRRFSKVNLLAKLRRPAQEGRTTLRRLDSLIGSLNWASALWGTAPYKRALLDLKADFMDGRPWSRHLASEEIVLDDGFNRTAELWNMLCELFGDAPIAKGIRQHVCPFNLYSDASGDAWSYAIPGLGVYDTAEFPAAWKDYIFHYSKFAEIFIGQLEGMASLRGLRYLCPRFPNTQIFVHVDNLGLMHQLRRLSARDQVMTNMLREVAVLLAAFGCTLRVHFIKSELNVWCDYLGRQGQASFTKQQAQQLAALNAQADVDRAKAAAAGLLDVRPAARPELLELLEAERCQALELDTSWSPQKRDGLEALVREHAAVQRRYEQRQAAHRAAAGSGDV